MNSKILNEIYHGQLKPWLFSLDERELKQTIREVSKMPSTTLQGLDNRLKTLLKPEILLLHFYNQHSKDYKFWSRIYP